MTLEEGIQKVKRARSNWHPDTLKAYIAMLEENKKVACEHATGELCQSCIDEAGKAI